MTRATGAVIRLSGKVKFQTAKAICFICSLDSTEFETIQQEEENAKGIWFPFSQVTEIHRDVPDTPDELVVSHWIAKQKGISV